MIAALVLLIAPGKPLDVGDGKAYARIEAALVAAQPGTTIRVWPSKVGYAKTALLVSRAGIHIESVGDKPIVLDGTGFDYSGVGSVPRAIIQFEPTAKGSTVKGFLLKGARNQSHNGAGVRINGASDVIVRDCEIKFNDMGIMSALPTATNQFIDHCHIHHNGSSEDPGYNHNLYLGGMSVTVRRCEIDHATTGHDLKSRAHYTVVQECFLHDSANREIDLVEAGETAVPNSNALLRGNLILKTAGVGNGNTIHFGREKGTRNGTLYLISNTIVTDSMAPVILLSDSDATANLQANVIVSKGQSSPTLLGVANGAKMVLTGMSNWISPKYTGDECRTLRLSVIEPLPDSFSTYYTLSSHPMTAVYTDGGGASRETEALLGYSGSEPWK